MNRNISVAVGQLLTDEQHRAYLENAQFKNLVDTLFTVLVPGLLRVFHEEAENNTSEYEAQMAQVQTALLDPEMARAVTQFIDYAQSMADADGWGTEDET